MAKHLRIIGIVQGVGYRAGFDAQARSLGLAGWVRNRRDGSVEAMVCGEHHALEKIITWAHRGPMMARVDQVNVEEVDDVVVDSDRFDIRATE
ncbi:MAG TPA: acylphosphatase [Oxalicibacterium sp.]|jgi:acylphosphatase|nr:acylphosphatase [Oxalicibacterium sp.]